MKKIRARSKESPAEIADGILGQVEVPPYKDITRIIPLILGSLCIIIAIVMVYQGIAAYGSIDIKAVFLKGKITSGSAGILFAFVGLVLILVGSLKRARRIRTLIVKKDGEEVIEVEAWVRVKDIDAFLKVAEAAGLLEDESVQELKKKIEDEF